MVAEAEGREWVPPEPGPEPEPQPEPMSEAEFHEKLDQIVRGSQRNPEPEPEADADPQAADRAAMYAEISQDLAAIGEGIRELAAQGEEAAASRAEAYEEILREPAAGRQPQAQAQAEPDPSWQAGDAVFSRRKYCSYRPHHRCSAGWRGTAGHRSGEPGTAPTDHGHTAHADGNGPGRVLSQPGVAL